MLNAFSNHKFDKRLYKNCELLLSNLGLNKEELTRNNNLRLTDLLISTDIPLLPAMGKMSKGSTPNFVVNWLNNKELQYTLAAETLLQVRAPPPLPLKPIQTLCCLG